MRMDAVMRTMGIEVYKITPEIIKLRRDQAILSIAACETPPSQYNAPDGWVEVISPWSIQQPNQQATNERCHTPESVTEDMQKDTVHIQT